jgi:hypothetical protein
MTREPVLKNSTEEELGRAVEENVFAMLSSMSEVLNGEIEEKPQLSRYHILLI